MEIFDGRYYKYSKRCMKTTGLWPYLSDRRRKISSFIFYVVNMTLVLPTFIELQQKFGIDFNITIENILSLMFTAGCCTKFIVANSSTNQLKTLFAQIAKDWQRIPAGTEKDILAKNSEEGRLLTIFYIVYISFAWFIYINIPFLPLAVDIIFPLNESRPLLLPFYANYIFFDQYEYYYLSCVHLGIVYLTSLFLFAGVDTTFVISVKHSCGLFDIISHRLESLIKDNEKEDFTRLLNNKALVKRIREIVLLHKDSIRCCELLEDTFSASFLVLNSMSVFGLALIVVYVLIIFGDFFKSFRLIVLSLGLLIHLLYINWVGQMIIDSSENVFNSAYSSNWYLASNSIRKITGIMMVRALYPCQLTAGKITILCIESFGILMKATMSYVTVFLSVM